MNEALAKAVAESRERKSGRDLARRFWPDKSGERPRSMSGYTATSNPGGLRQLLEGAHDIVSTLPEVVLSADRTVGRIGEAFSKVRSPKK